MAQGVLRTAIVLGLVSAIGPFAVDMYLPSLPTIGAGLHADGSSVQLSLLAFFLALALGQPVYGPLSDAIGRKAPLYAGLALFAAASIGCALAPDIRSLIVLRFIEGLGACAGMVIPRAVVRDLHTGPEAARLMSLLMLVFSISPILAPLAGTAIAAVAGWRAVFWTVTLAATLGAAMLAIWLPETLPTARRGGRPADVGAAYVALLRDARFVGVSAIGAFGIASFFAYIANAPFVLIQHYGLSSTAFSLLFAANAASFFLVAQLAGRLTARFGLVAVVRGAALGFAAVMVALFVAVAAGMSSLAGVVVLLWAGYGLLGLVVPTSAVLALEEHGAKAGAASSLMGTIQFLVGAAVMLASGLAMDGTVLPMVAAIAACSALTLLASCLTFGVRLRQRAPAA